MADPTRLLPRRLLGALLVAAFALLLRRASGSASFAQRSARNSRWGPARPTAPFVPGSTSVSSPSSWASVTQTSGTSSTALPITPTASTAVSIPSSQTAADVSFSPYAARSNFAGRPAPSSPPPLASSPASQGVAVYPATLPGTPPRPSSSSTSSSLSGWAPRPANSYNAPQSSSSAVVGSSRSYSAPAQLPSTSPIPVSTVGRNDSAFSFATSWASESFSTSQPAQAGQEWSQRTSSSNSHWNTADTPRNLPSTPVQSRGPSVLGDQGASTAGNRTAVGDTGRVSSWFPTPGSASGSSNRSASFAGEGRAGTTGGSEPGSLSGTRVDGWTGIGTPLSSSDTSGGSRWDTSNETATSFSAYRSWNPTERSDEPLSQWGRAIGDGETTNTPRGRGAGIGSTETWTPLRSGVYDSSRSHVSTSPVVDGSTGYQVSSNGSRAGVPESPWTSGSGSVTDMSSNTVLPSVRAELADSSFMSPRGNLHGVPRIEEWRGRSSQQESVFKPVSSQPAPEELVSTTRVSPRSTPVTIDAEQASSMASDSTPAASNQQLGRLGESEGQIGGLPHAPALSTTPLTPNLPEPPQASSGLPPTTFQESLPAGPPRVRSDAPPVTGGGRIDRLGEEPSHRSSEPPRHSVSRSSETVSSQEEPRDTINSVSLSRASDNAGSSPQTGSVVTRKQDGIRLASQRSVQEDQFQRAGYIPSFALDSRGGPQSSFAESDPRTSTGQSRETVGMVYGTLDGYMEDAKDPFAGQLGALSREDKKGFTVTSTTTTSTYTYPPYYNPYNDNFDVDQIPDSPYHNYMYAEDPFPSPYSTHSRHENYGSDFNNRYYHEQRIAPNITWDEYTRRKKEMEAARKRQDELQDAAVGVLEGSPTSFQGLIGYPGQSRSPRS